MFEARVRGAYTTPRARAVAGPVIDWLAALNADELYGGEIPPARHFTFDDWEISLIPIARSPGFRGCPDNRLIGGEGGSAGYTNDSTQIRRALTRKNKHYGTPDTPLVVAALALNGFVQDQDVANTLFGSEAVRINLETGATSFGRSPDGLWVGERTPCIEAVQMLTQPH